MTQWAPTMLGAAARAAEVTQPQTLPGGTWGWPRTVVEATLGPNGDATIDLSDLARRTLGARAADAVARDWRAWIVGIAQAQGAPTIALRLRATDGIGTHSHDYDPGDVLIPVAQTSGALPEALAGVPLHGSSVALVARSLVVTGGVPGDAVRVVVGAVITMVAP